MGFGTSERLPGDDLASCFDSAALAEAIEAREVVEPTLARLAALRRRDHDLERLRDALSGMRESCHRLDRFLEFDYAFHLALADASGNRVLIDAQTRTLRGPTREMIALFTCDAGGRRLEALIGAHGELLSAIERCDPDEAERIVREMLIRFRLEVNWIETTQSAKVQSLEAPMVGRWAQMFDTKEIDRENR